MCKGSAGVKLKSVSKIDGFNARRVLAFWFQARSTNDSMSLLTMIMNPDRANDLGDLMNKLDRWDAPIRDYEMKFEKDDISDKMRQAALFATAPEAVVESRLAGRRDLDNYAKVRCMIDDMIRDEREARGAIKLSGGGNQPPPDVDQLKLREMTSDFAEEASEGGKDTSSVQKLAESLSAIVETLNPASKGRAKEKVKTVSGPKNLPREVSGRAHRRDRMRRATASRGRSLRKQEGPLKNPREKARAKAGVEERPKAREKASHATCAEGLGTPRGCAPVKDGLMTWSRTRLKEKTPMKTAAGPKRTTRHSNWGTLAASLV